MISLLRSLLAAIEGRPLALPSDADAGKVLAVARQHRLTPLLSLADPGDAPASMKEACRRDRLITSARNMLLAHAAEECAAAFAADGTALVICSRAWHTTRQSTREARRAADERRRSVGAGSRAAAPRSALSTSSASSRVPPPPASTTPTITRSPGRAAASRSICTSRWRRWYAAASTTTICGRTFARRASALRALPRCTRSTRRSFTPCTWRSITSTSPRCIWSTSAACCRRSTSAIGPRRWRTSVGLLATLRDCRGAGRGVAPALGRGAPAVRRYRFRGRCCQQLWRPGALAPARATGSQAGALRPAAGRDPLSGGTGAAQHPRAVRTPRPAPVRAGEAGARTMTAARIGMVNLASQRAPLQAELGGGRIACAQVGSLHPGAGGGGVRTRDVDVRARRARGGRVVRVGCAALRSSPPAGSALGDEVITTPFSFFATVGSDRPRGRDAGVRRRRCRDAEPGHRAARAARIGPRTRAVLVVHLFGRMVDVRGTRRRDCAAAASLVEDAAQAIGASPSDGGDRARSARRRRCRSSRPRTWARWRRRDGADRRCRAGRKGPCDSRPRRARATRHEAIGGNFRLDELQAALLRVKLASLPAWTRRRREIAALYRQAWADLPIGLPPPDPGLRLEPVRDSRPGGRRDALAAHLPSAASTPPSITRHRCTCSRALASGRAAGAAAARRGRLRRGARGTVHAELTSNEVERVCEGLRSFFAAR